MTVEIKGLIEASLIDWPGKLATVVFVPGCNLRCRYCHARDIVTGADAIEAISAERVFDYLEESDGWIDGVVISGGEPTLYPRLRELAARVKAAGLGVKLDTNGTRPKVLASLIRDGLVDDVAMDVKAPLDYRYFEVTRSIIDLDAIRASIALLMESGIDYEFARRSRRRCLPRARSARSRGRYAARGSTRSRPSTPTSASMPSWSRIRRVRPRTSTTRRGWRRGSSKRCPCGCSGSGGPRSRGDCRDTKAVCLP